MPRQCVLSSFTFFFFFFQFNVVLIYFNFLRLYFLLDSLTRARQFCQRDFICFITLGSFISDIFFCLLINLTLNSCSCLDVVIGLQEFIKFIKTLSYIVQRNNSVFVEVKSEPVLLYKYGDIAVSLFHVLDKILLSFYDNFKQKTDEILSLVIKQNNLLIELSNSFNYVFCQT